MSDTWADPVMVGATAVRSSREALRYIETHWRDLPTKERDAAYILVFSAVTSLGQHHQARRAFVTMLQMRTV